MKRLFTLLLAQVALQASDAQKNFFPGYIIENNGDTGFCKIDFKDWVFNPEEISTETGAGITKRTVHNISGFSVQGYHNYEAIDITYHESSISDDFLPLEYSNETKTKRVFLKVLCKGEYTLFQYEDSKRVYFFYRSGNGKIEELLYRVKKRDLLIEEDISYKHTIQVLFIEEGLYAENKQKIENMSYINPSMVSIFSILNRQENHDNSQANNKSNKLALEIFAGILLNNLSDNIDYGLQTIPDFRNEVSYAAGMNFVFYIPSRFQRIGLGISTGISNLKASESIVDMSTTVTGGSGNYYTNITTRNSNLNVTRLFLDLNLRYRINPLDKVNIFVRGGNFRFF